LNPDHSCFQELFQFRQNPAQDFFTNENFQDLVAILCRILREINGKILSRFCADVGQDLDRKKRQIYVKSIAVPVLGLSRIDILE
jgi:hypothetical protein